MSTALAEQVGSYRLVRRIGSGGMGEVWLGEHVVSGGLGAVKRLSAAAAQRGLVTEVFAREGRAIARLSHPHVVALFEVGPDYVVTAFVDGISLSRRMVTPIEPAAAITIIRQIASALAHAHERGVIHRDIKPSNILLDRNGTAFLADFGVASLGDDTLAGVVGTPTYMAPEQRRGEPATPAADQFALARTAIDLLAGGAPPTDLGAAIAGLPATLPEGVRDVLARGVATEPAARFPDVAAFAAALAAFDLSAHEATVHLAAPLRLDRRYAWASGAHRRTPLGVDVVRCDYRLRDLAARGVIADAAPLLAETGLDDIGFSTWMATSRLGEPTSPAAFARAREVIVLLHGWAQTRDCWRLIAPALCRDNALAVVITPDVHGFGETRFTTPPGHDQGALSAIARAAVGLGRVLGTHEIPSVIVGHSMSGMGLLALDDTAFAPLTSRVAINPLLVRHNRALRRQLARYAWLARMVGWARPVRNLIIRLTRAWMHLRDIVDEEQDRTVEVRIALPGRVEARLLHAFAYAPFTVGRQPRVALIANVDDPWIPPGDVLASAVADLGLHPAQVHRMASGGHLPHLESRSRPEHTARNVDEILRVIQSMIVTAHESTSVTPAGTPSGDATETM